ncbi:hypothetical protein DUNSADRAFT_1506 [Dunaliella salina]|uniref:PAS domain-containing protein n=1 Tax=Dunaliella salina TaxID=3046 RepID=A0ABQ7GWW3_DUNSA|nr:hypothetical protein DUNSADRAFT_1506 [Dunaliella salina]|eukprot:KAF5839108.1 hypothetical protein DUNSADRAFT_1506 [Dunaliella salina]
MGQCASGGIGPLQESQARQGRQHPAGKEEVPGHKLEAEALKLKTHEDIVTPSYKPHLKTPSTYSLPHHDAAENHLLNNAKDSASVSELCQGGVHDCLASGPPVCACEAGRVQTFEAYAIDKLFEPCPELDIVLQAVCRVFSVQYASFALYHNQTCVQCNTVGYNGVGELQWNLTACPWNLMCSMPQTIACRDLREDARYADQPWTLQGLRTYVSAPILGSNGERLGSCCFMDPVPRKVDAGMCRLLNNFGEIAVRVLERHIGIAVRLAQARLTAMQLSDATVNLPQPLPETVKALDSSAIEDKEHQQQQQLAKGSSLDKAGSALVVNKGGWVQQLQGAGPEAQAAAVAAACQSYGAWWGDDANSAEAASTAAAAAVAEVEGPRAGLGGSKGGALQQARNPQLQLYNVFQREFRNTARTADACVLLVDTGHPDWPVIYADETWQEWAGYSRDAILGRGLFELLQPAAPSVAPCRRDQLQAEAQAGARFVLHGQVAVPQGTRETDLVRAVSMAGSVVSLPTLHTSGPGPSSTQMGHENASECVLHSIDSSVVLGQPKRGRSSNLDSLGSNVATPQRGPSSTGRKGDILMSAEGYHQRQPQQEHVRQSLDFWQKEQPKTSDCLLRTHSSIKSEQPSSASAWSARPSTDAYALPPASLTPVSNRECLGSDARADTAAKAGRSLVFDLSFRPAALDVLDCDALPLGVPSFVLMETSGRLLSLYMVRLHKRGEEVVQPANKPFEPSAKVTRVSQANPTLLAPRFFPGMRVQQVLGAGGYGTAYQGQWHDTPVVLKVQDYMLSSSKELLEAQLEVLLGQLLNHPNLVHTLAHATVELPPDSLVPFSQAKQASHKQKASKARATHN